MQALAFNLINRSGMTPQVINTYPGWIIKKVFYGLGSFCCDGMKIPKMCP